MQLHNNFTKKKIYNLSKAYLRKPVAESLLKAQMEFKTLGYSPLRFTMHTDRIQLLLHFIISLKIYVMWLLRKKDLDTIKDVL
jgi:hypothetical protein